MSDVRPANVLLLRGLILPDGMQEAEIAAELGVPDSTIVPILEQLLKDGDIERSEDGFRLRALDRSTRSLFLRAANLLHAGEWTTYSDISIVATGTDASRQSVGRIAATDPLFPNPHRILQSDGSITGSWKDQAGNGPEYCQQLLEAEGIRFSGKGIADPKQRVDAATLQARWDSSPADSQIGDD